MAEYITVTLTCNGNKHNFHAKQDKHNHTKCNEFGIACKKLMEKQYPGGTVTGHQSYKSKQSSHNNPSNEMVYKNGQWVQGKG